MLQKTNPRIIELQTWIDNHNDLLAVVYKHIEKNPNCVDLDSFVSNCGSYACLYGWWCKLCGVDSLDIVDDSIKFFGLTHEANNAEDFLNGTGRWWGHIFGAKECGTLSQRKQRIKSHIKRFEAERDLILSGGVWC